MGESPGKTNNEGGYFREAIPVKRTFVHYDSPKTNRTIQTTPPKTVPHSFKPTNAAPVMLFSQHQTVTGQPPLVGYASPCASPMPLNRHQTSTLQPQTSGTTTLRLSDYLPSPVISQGAAPASQSLGGMAADFPNFQVLQPATQPATCMTSLPTVPLLPGQPGQPQQCYQTGQQPGMPQPMPVSLDVSLQQTFPQVQQPQPSMTVEMPSMANIGMAIGASIAPLQQSYQINQQYQASMANNNFQGQSPSNTCMASSFQAPQMSGFNGMNPQFWQNHDQSMCMPVMEEPQSMSVTSLPNMGTQISPTAQRGIQGPILQVSAGPRWSDMNPMEPHMDA